jgi:predicted kinase
MSGLPVSGKSTIAEGLAEKLALPIFPVDSIISAILTAGAKRTPETDMAAFLIAERLASEQMGLGISVVIDAVNAVNEVRQIWRNLSAKHHAQMIIIECVLDEALHKKRIESRVRNLPGFPETTWKHVEDRRKSYESWQEERLVLNTADDAADNLEKALNYINHCQSSEKKE